MYNRNQGLCLQVTIFLIVMLLFIHYPQLGNWLLKEKSFIH